MKKALKVLLNDLDKVAEEFDEVTDTDVREQMRDAIEKAVLDPVRGYKLPSAFGMFEPEGDAQVRAVLAKFIAAAKAEAKAAGLKTRADRLRAFQNIDVESRAGNFYDDYFGHDDSLDEPEPPPPPKRKS
ncbi:MAG TPA: hypothetical protein PKC45_01745 [Gemmatales bacterium]|nr:hypothetical protein [Gemmatales bacterium]